MSSTKLRLPFGSRETAFSERPGITQGMRSSWTAEWKAELGLRHGVTIIKKGRRRYKPAKGLSREKEQGHLTAPPALDACAAETPPFPP